MGPGVSRADSLEDGGVRGQNSIDIPLTNVDIVSAQHELHNIGLGVLNPADDVVPGNVICLPARVALVVRVKAGWPRALGLKVGHGAHEIDTARQSSRDELVPDQWPPACNLSNGISKKHCMSY